MRLFKQKLALIAPIAVIVILVIFSINLVVQGDPKPENLPVALVVNDDGEQATVLKKALLAQEKSVDGKEPMFDFTIVNDEKSLDQSFNDQEYYAALIIPKGFSEAVTSITKTNTPAAVTIKVNQGMNSTGANYANQGLSAVVDAVSNQVSQQVLSSLEESKHNITATQVKALATPITKNIESVNAVTKATANGNAPILMAMPAWVGALIGGMLLLLATQKIKFTKRTDRLSVMAEQIVLGIVMALLSGFTVATLATWSGMNLPSYSIVLLFIAFAYFCFFMLVSATVAWIGKPAIMIFMVMMLVGMGTITMPPEMLPSFLANYVRTWMPMRFAADGLREIFYFGTGFYTGSPSNVLMGIGGGALIVYLLSALKPIKSVKEIKNNSDEQLQNQ